MEKKKEESWWGIAAVAALPRNDNLGGVGKTTETTPPAGYPAGGVQRVKKVFLPRCAVFQTFFICLKNLFD